MQYLNKDLEQTQQSVLQETVGFAALPYVHRVTDHIGRLLGQRENHLQADQEDTAVPETGKKYQAFALVLQGIWHALLVWHDLHRHHEVQCLYLRW